MSVMEGEIKEPIEGGKENNRERKKNRKGREREMTAEMIGGTYIQTRELRLL